MSSNRKPQKMFDQFPSSAIVDVLNAHVLFLLGLRYVNMCSEGNISLSFLLLVPSLCSDWIARLLKLKIFDSLPVGDLEADITPKLPR